MSNPKPTEVLEREHHYIQQVGASLLLLAEELEKGEAVPAETLADTLEFLRTFADRCHHGKEEAFLFPLLEQKGVPPQGCPLGVLKKEHVAVRRNCCELHCSAWPNSTEVTCGKKITSCSRWRTRFCPPRNKTS